MDIIRPEVLAPAGDAERLKAAIYYGAVCSAVYPILSLLDSLSNTALKQIDIRADFESTKPDFAFSARVKLRLFFLLAAALAALSEFNKFKTRNEL